MRSWASGSYMARICSGRFLKRALWGVLLIPVQAFAQSSQTLPPRKAAAKRLNELTLARSRLTASGRTALVPGERGMDWRSRILQQR